MNMGIKVAVWAAAAISTLVVAVADNDDVPENPASLSEEELMGLDHPEYEPAASASDSG